VAVLGHKTWVPGKLSTGHTGQGPAGEEIQNPGWFNGLVGHQKPAKQQTMFSQNIARSQAKAENNLTHDFCTSVQSKMKGNTNAIFVFEQIN
jgi:hypothetical protein